LAKNDELNLIATSKEVSNGKAALLGFQHLLSMYSGDMIVPLLIGAALHFSAMQMAYLVSIDIFMCGIATLLQLRKTRYTGIALPVVLGAAIQVVTPLISIGQKMGLAVMYGSIIGAGIFIFLVSGLFSKVRNLFPPIVTGSLITVIGFSLVPVGFEDLGGGDVSSKSFGDPKYLLIGFVTMIVILLFNSYASGLLKSLAILIGLVTGTALAGAMGMISLHAVATASWFHIPRPFFFATPKFEWSSIITMMVVSLTTMVESTGVFFALADITGSKLSTDDLKRGYRAEGIAAILGGIFNTFPYSTFSENVGVLQLSGVKSKKPIYFAAAFLLILGLLPKVGALATIIPTPVLGGAMIVMFGMVGVQGIRMLQAVDFRDNHNLLVAAISIGLGMGVTVYPQVFQELPEVAKLILTNGIVIASFSAVILNAMFHFSIGNKQVAAEVHSDAADKIEK